MGALFLSNGFETSILLMTNLLESLIDYSEKLYKDNNYKFGLNLEHGLSLEYYYNYLLSEKPLIGTLEQGFYKNKNFNADFYSGHLVSEFLNKRNVTDLSQKIYKPKIIKRNNLLEISTNFKIMNTLVKKKWIFNFDKHCSDQKKLAKLAFDTRASRN